MKLSLHSERWATQIPFRIAGKSWDAFESLVVELSEDGFVGRGEGLGVYYRGETVASMTAQIERVAGRITAGLDRISLQILLPAGGARNALDCAMWDLQAKRAQRSIFELAEVTPKNLETIFTIGLERTPEAMAERARAAPNAQLKIKLDGNRPFERVRAIRAARPDARIIVDANQGWTLAQLIDLAPQFVELGVEMIEQPLPRGQDEALEAYQSPVPLGADESCLHLEELADVSRRYDFINIKLDKTGGLTHALELARAARGLGLGLMVGCMGGSSLAMAPAFVVGCLCDLVDIDGPLLQTWDRLPGLSYDRGHVQIPEPHLWG
jgi:L-Ala-D/L-Glu epimerase